MERARAYIEVVGERKKIEENGVIIYFKELKRIETLVMKINTHIFLLIFCSSL